MGRETNADVLLAIVLGSFRVTGCRAYGNFQAQCCEVPIRESTDIFSVSTSLWRRTELDISYSL